MKVEKVDPSEIKPRSKVEQFDQELKSLKPGEALRFTFDSTQDARVGYSTILARTKIIAQGKLTINKRGSYVYVTRPSDKNGAE